VKELLFTINIWVQAVRTMWVSYRSFYLAVSIPPGLGVDTCREPSGIQSL